MEYEKPISTPEQPTVTPYANGLRIDLDHIPEGCSVDIVIDSAMTANTKGSSYMVSCAAGQHFIEIAYRDSFGVGEFCDTVSVIVPASNTNFYPYPDFDEQDRLVIYYPDHGYIVVDDGVMTIPENGATMEIELQRANLPHKILHIQ